MEGPIFQRRPAAERADQAPPRPQLRPAKSRAARRRSFLRPSSVPLTRVDTIPEPEAERAHAAGGASVPASNGQLGAASSSVGRAMASPSRPLEPTVRQDMEQRFGHDFSMVRVHTDAKAAESARAVDALAYTVGQDIVFSEGHYAHHSREGSKLLAHELAHVIQQERGADSPSRRQNGVVEQDADAAATAFVEGRRPIHVGESSGPGLARQARSDGPRVPHSTPHRAASMQPRAQLVDLAREAERRRAASARGVSTAEAGPSSATVPLAALVSLPEPLDAHKLFNELKADPGGGRGQQLAVRYVVGQYLSGKLDWPVKVELLDPGGEIWFSFSAHGKELVASRTLELPISVLDGVSAESLSTVTDRATQIVEVASLEAASSYIVANIGDRPEAMIANPEEFARNEAVALRFLADRYLGRIEALSKTLSPSNEWLHDVLAARRQAFLPIMQRVRRADTLTNKFQNENSPPTYAGETYDRVISESSGVERAGWWVWKQLGDAVTLGGQSTQAQNVRMYRRGEISLDEYKKNWVLNIGRVGVKAVITALTAGRATGPAMRFLGLEAGTAAATVTASTVEGVTTGFAQEFSSDVYAKVVATVSRSPGVAAFHEQTIAGPGGWAESAGFGGLFGMAGGLTSELLSGTSPAAPPEAAIPTDSPESAALSEQPEAQPTPTDSPPVSELDPQLEELPDTSAKSSQYSAKVEQRAPARQQLTVAEADKAVVKARAELEAAERARRDATAAYDKAREGGRGTPRKGPRAAETAAKESVRKAAAKVKAAERRAATARRAAEKARQAEAAREKARTETPKGAVPRLGEVPGEPFSKEKWRPLFRRNGPTMPSAVTISKRPLQGRFLAPLKRILKLAETNPQQAGNEFAQLIGEENGWGKISERFSERHGSIGRRWDFGNTKEMTIEGRLKGPQLGQARSAMVRPQRARLCRPHGAVPLPCSGSSARPSGR